MNLKWGQIVVVFLIGFVLGGFLGSSKLRRYFRKPMDREAAHHAMVEKFSSRLRLSNDQKVQVEAILTDKRTKVESLFAEMRPRFDTIRTETGAEIKKILSPEQQKKFEALDAEMESRFKNRFFPPASK